MVEWSAVEWCGFFPLFPLFVLFCLIIHDVCTYSCSAYLLLTYLMYLLTVVKLLTYDSMIAMYCTFYFLSPVVRVTDE
ncbi:hypothetical protein BZA05DRAFT_392969 [Tricharina praecox]|uniref:uncharacterized protein n=1 Tax=Tricharina praecox TaxID=43433 RepID=UPI00221F66D6|nr:uncharacterized protein BZA05DRAFT_392969 [Tricharina praecox]KAI5854925.1 hypothetical protein BZA05DRAFT_392969 [Tricharina praecox]